MSTNEVLHKKETGAFKENCRKANKWRIVLRELDIKGSSVDHTCLSLVL